jgi:hypothetical protein
MYILIYTTANIYCQLMYNRCVAKNPLLHCEEQQQPALSQGGVSHHCCWSRHLGCGDGCCNALSTHRLVLHACSSCSASADLAADEILNGPDLARTRNSIMGLTWHGPGGGDTGAQGSCTCANCLNSRELWPKSGRFSRHQIITGNGTGNGSPSAFHPSAGLQITVARGR